MYLIGLTGGIASGKSTVSKMLVDSGGCLIDADKIAREIVEPYKPAWQDIVNKFGEEILLADKTIDRAKLGNIIFSDKDSKKYLNAVTHPRIKEEIKNRIARYRNEKNAILILDIPLLFESGWDKSTDENWLVYVNQSVQLERLMARNQLSEKQAMDRIHSQILLEDKMKHADYIIDNNGTLEYTRSQVIVRWNEVKKKMEEKDN
ncbi:MAG: Dephospho-CoA kinase [Firmicutes bacterium]|nr:Dephospho-CoA kinase [Bacillota bacterium]